MSMVEKYWSAERRYHHTPPVNMLFGLHEALRLLQEEGLEASWNRHCEAQVAFVAGIEALGLKMFVDDPAIRAATVNTIRIPQGVDDARVRTCLLQRFNIEIAGGLADLKGKIWRVDVAAKNGQSIPFNAHVEQTINDALRFKQTVAPDEFPVRMLRDVTTSLGYPPGRPDQLVCAPLAPAFLEIGARHR